jgi:hypothetical protein
MYDSFRKCHSCGFNGYMDRWFTKSVYPFLIASILLLLGFIPGIVFIAVNKNKLKCPECGVLRN